MSIGLAITRKGGKKAEVQDHGGALRPMIEPNMIGAYGPWAASLVGEGPARLSFRLPKFEDLDEWRALARERLVAGLLQPETGGVPKAQLQRRWEYKGLEIEHLNWQLPYGPPTEALLLKPAGAQGRLPAVLALHDHGGNKYFGSHKIAQGSDTIHPVMRRHRDRYYEGVSWANELAHRGYVVLVHDAFAFASRRVRLDEVPAVLHDGLREPDPESESEIEAYNDFARHHEHILAKSLFCAGTTWPGTFLAEDQRALDYLCSRPDVDPARVGCAGLSGGGLRVVYLSGLDDRIACACCIGMMTTWRDYLLNRSYRHSWMVYIPGLASDLDYPEILGLHAPKPTLVLNNKEDALFTMPEMERADQILSEHFAKAGASDHYRATFHPGGHKFDLPMQQEAFDWLDLWLRS